MIHILLAGIPLVLFLIYKVTHLWIRLSDTNLYFMMGQGILHGRTLYYDMFFTNLPLFPYISALYSSFGNLNFYYFTGSLEVVGCYALLYLIGKKRTNSTIIAWLSAMLFLCSFTILYTSDSQTGVITASLFSLLAYFFVFNKHNMLVGGICIALTFLTKAYTAPVLVTFFITLIIRKRFKDVTVLTLAAGITVLLVIVPFYIQSGSAMIQQLLYAGSRSESFPKSELILNFVIYDSLLCIAGVSTFLTRKMRPASIALICFIIFFVIRGSFYPIYMTMIIPFLCIASQDMLHMLAKKAVNSQIIPAMVLAYCLVTVLIYVSSFARLGVINDLSAILSEIKENRPHSIYGVADIAPALSYLSNTPLVDNIIDTNSEIFDKGFFDKTRISKDVLSSRTIVVTEGIYLPEAHIDEYMDNSTFDKKLLLKSCSLLKGYQVEGQELINRLYLFRCYRHKDDVRPDLRRGRTVWW